MGLTNKRKCPKCKGALTPYENPDNWHPNDDGMFVAHHRDDCLRRLARKANNG